MSFVFLDTNSTIVDKKSSKLLRFREISENVMVSIRQSRTDMVRFVLDKRFFNVDKCRTRKQGRRVGFRRVD